MKRYGLKTALLLAGLGLSVQLYAQTGVSTAPQPKAVLLEEQTGMGCGNCPDGAAMITALQARLGHALQVISYHVGHYAEPNPGQPDFRTAYGDSLLEFWGEYGYPQGEIDRLYLPSSPTMAVGRGRWTEAIESRLADMATVNLYAAAGLDATTRTLTVNVEGYYVEASEAKENYLHVALIQNHVSGPQNQAPAGYLHEHMFRDFLTPLWGDTLSTTAKGTKFTKTYTYTVPENYRGVAADVRNLEIVVFVAKEREEVLNTTGCKPALSGLNDPAAATLTLGTLPNRYCARDFEAALESRYNDTIKRIAYEVKLNGEKKTYEMDVEVPPYEQKPVTLRIDAYDPVAQNTVEFRITALNGAAYNGNTAKATFNEPLPAVAPLIVEMSTDAHPEECYWYVADQDGNVVLEYGPYPAGEPVSAVEGLKLDSGLYSLYFRDTKWDGWQVKPRGSYKIKDIDGKLVAQNYDLRDKGDILAVRVTRRKTSGDTTAIETVEALQDTRLYPNPATEVVYLSGRAAETGLWTYTLTDIQGRVFGNGTLATTAAQAFEQAILLQGIPQGLYLLCLQTRQSTYVFRITKR